MSLLGAFGVTTDVVPALLPAWLQGLLVGAEMWCRLSACLLGKG